MPQQFLIELTTTEGQVVLDPFAGSGTTLVAALKLGRHFIGYEQEKSYYDVAFQRIQKEKDNLQNQLF